MAEMKGMVLSTGGMAVQTDTYHNTVFKVCVVCKKCVRKRAEAHIRARMCTCICGVVERLYTRHTRCIAYPCCCSQLSS